MEATALYSFEGLVAKAFFENAADSYFINNLKNVIGIGGIWNWGCSETSDAANPPATLPGLSQII